MTINFSPLQEPGELTMGEKDDIWQELNQWARSYSQSRMLAVPLVRPASQKRQRPAPYAFILVSGEQGMFLIEVNAE